MAPSSDYTARHLSVLEGLEAVRKRPGMYIGSTDSRGLMHCLWEIIDNSVDEALAGYGHDIKVILHADNSVEIHDDGRGIPVDVEPKTGLTGVEVVFTKLHAGGKFGGGSYAASGGLHGVGASVVNALSARLDVEVDRGGKTYKMSFRRGEPGRFKDRRRPDPATAFEPFIDGSVLDVVGKAKRGVTGTRIRYWADRQIFPARRQISYDELATRARQTSFLVPGLNLTVRDERRLPAPRRESGPHEEVFHHDGGISSSASTSPPTRPSRRLAPHGPGTSRRPSRSSTSRATAPRRSTATARWTSPCAGGSATTARSVLRQHHRHPQGRHPPPGFEQALPKTFRKAVRDQCPQAEGRRGRQDRKGRHLRGPDRGRHRPARRAAVRGPDQGDPRHLGRAGHRGQGGRSRRSAPS